MRELKTTRKSLPIATVQSIITPPKLHASNEPENDSQPVKKSSPLDRLKQRLSFRHQKKENTSTTTTPTTNNNNNNGNKSLQWKDDAKAVRAGTCSFNVKYLGSIEVQESRGIHVCEQAIHALLNKKEQCQKAVLYISGDALRVVDKINKGLIVDQTIEKVSFCAPDRHNNKGFAYICRDGATRRWLCHAFLAVDESGERLSHTVGCAFQICLERKQKRDRDCNVNVEYTPNRTSFARYGSFRTTPITERMIDPQSALIVEPIPCALSDQKDNVNERPRPKGNSPETCIRSPSIRREDFNPMTINTYQQKYHLSPIEQTKYKNSVKDTIPEEAEIISTINEMSNLSLFNSTNISSHNYIPFQSNIPLSPPTSPLNSWFTNSPSILSDGSNPTSPQTIHDAFNSNLTSLAHSNHPINPFSPYGYSITAQSFSSDIDSSQSSIFTPKRSTNPFDDDILHR